MKSIDRALVKYLTGTGAKVSVQEISIYATHNGDALIDTLFNILNRELDFYVGEKSLDKLKEAFGYMDIILANATELNRRYLLKRLNRLETKLGRIEYERRNVFSNPNKVHEEFQKLIARIQELKESTVKADSKQFDFMSYLVMDTCNIAYVEFTLKKLPQLVNVKDKDGKSIYATAITEFLETLDEEDDEKTLYLINLISLLQSQPAFKLLEQEKRKILEEIYKNIEWLTHSKKLAKQNREKIRYIEIIKEMVKQENEGTKDIESIATKYNVPIYFSEDLTGAVTLIQKPDDPKKYLDREVVTDYTVTIDGSDAVEIDDALSCVKLPNGNYMLGVHIASVLGYFPYESEIIEEAFRRNQSIYLRHPYQDCDDDYSRVVPIFPYEFSADKASLKEGEPRLARTYYFEIDPRGNVVTQMFAKSIVTSNKKISYQDANHILRKKDSDNQQLQETLLNLQQVASILDKKYKTSDIYEIMKSSSANHADLKVQKKGAENIIYQCMLLTGTRVGEFFKKNGYPCLFRVLSLDKETDERTSEMIDLLLEGNEGSSLEKISHLVDSIYPKGSYDTEGRHDGLDLDYYCHCTSSLRRAQDILIEHALEVCYDQEPTEEELEELRAEIEKRKVQINSRSKPIDWFAHEYNRTYFKRRH